MDEKINDPEPSVIKILSRISKILFLLALVLAIWKVGNRIYHAPQIPENAFCEEKYMLRHQGDAK